MYKKIKNLNKLARIYWSYKTGQRRCNYTPLRIWLEPTDRCNLACPLCINRTMPEEKKGLMEWGLFRKIIDQLEDKICDINLFHRGEPLLHPQIVEMVAYIKGKGLTIRIHTNATKLTKEVSNALLHNGLDYISFSFDGFDKDTYEKNRVNADFKQTLNNILNFLKIKKELKADTFTVLQVINTNISTPPDVKRDFLKQFNNLPLNKLSIRNPHNWAGGISTPWRDRNRTKRPIVCTFPWYGLTIFYDGKVVPCCQDYMGKIYLGDANKEMLKDIWNNEILQKLRQSFTKRDYSQYAPCAKCDRLWRSNIFGVPLEYIGTFLREARIRK